jgi:hypothetical protein
MRQKVSLNVTTDVSRSTFLGRPKIGMASRHHNFRRSSAWRKISFGRPAFSFFYSTFICSPNGADSFPNGTDSSPHGANLESARPKWGRLRRQKSPARGVQIGKKNTRLMNAGFAGSRRHGASILVLSPDEARNGRANGHADAAPIRRMRRAKNMGSRTGVAARGSPGEELTACKISAVAVCCSRDSPRLRRFPSKIDHAWVENLPRGDRQPFDL